MRPFLSQAVTAVNMTAGRFAGPQVRAAFGGSRRLAAPCSSRTFRSCVGGRRSEHQNEAAGLSSVVESGVGSVDPGTVGREDGIEGGLKGQDWTRSTSTSADDGIDPNSQMYVNPASVDAAVEQKSKKEIPRWQKPADELVAPVSTNSRKGRPADPVYRQPPDPYKIERMYHAFLGPFSDEAKLTDRTKWLAITHKTYSQGRCGFNDRLSYLGKRIVNLQVSNALLSLSSSSKSAVEPDVYGRKPFVHPALDQLELVTVERRMSIVNKTNLARLGQKYGLPELVRWKPRDRDNLALSGEATVLAQACYAIIGAVALERGGQLAAKVALDRIVRPLGL